MFSRVLGIRVVAALIVCASHIPAAAHELALRWVTSEGRILADKTLTLAELDALTQTTFVTYTPWTEGPQTFAGPSLKVLASLENLAIVRARVVALNDYAASIPATDLTQSGAILATRLNEQTMRVRDKGPFWIMYSSGGDPSSIPYIKQSRMVWQVKYIEFVTK